MPVPISTASSTATTTAPVRTMRLPMGVQPRLEDHRRRLLVDDLAGRLGLPTTCLQPAVGSDPSKGQRLVELLRMTAAGSGDVGLLATTTADQRCRPGDEVAGVEPAVLGDRRDQGHATTVGHGTEHDRAHVGVVTDGDGE